jgi:hypothetical protein
MVEISENFKIADDRNWRNRGVGNGKRVGLKLGQLSSESTVHDLSLTDVALEHIQLAMQSMQREMSDDSSNMLVCWLPNKSHRFD